jgi:hypothetical protein
MSIPGLHKGTTKVSDGRPLNLSGSDMLANVVREAWSKKLFRSSLLGCAGFLSEAPGLTRKRDRLRRRLSGFGAHHIAVVITRLFSVTD